jgi:uncharacterized integral membrane protein
MQNLWLKIKIWTKVVIAAVIGLYVLIFVLKNGDEKATFWFWPYHKYEGSLLLLVAFTFLIGGLVAILATTTFRTLRQIRDLRTRNRAARAEALLRDQETKAAMLQTKSAGSLEGGVPVSELPPAPPKP